MFSFSTFAIAEMIAASVAHSESLLGDAATMVRTVPRTADAPQDDAPRDTCVCFCTWPSMWHDASPYVCAAARHAGKCACCPRTTCALAFGGCLCAEQPGTTRRLSFTFALTLADVWIIACPDRRRAQLWPQPLGRKGKVGEIQATSANDRHCMRCRVLVGWRTTLHANKRGACGLMLCNAQFVGDLQPRFQC